MLSWSSGLHLFLPTYLYLNMGRSCPRCPTCCTSVLCEWEWSSLPSFTMINSGHHLDHKSGPIFKTSFLIIWNQKNWHFHMHCYTGSPTPSFPSSIPQPEALEPECWTSRRTGIRPRLNGWRNKTAFTNEWEEPKGWLGTSYILHKGKELNLLP